MSQRLINHNADLKRLRDEGYDLEIREGFLLVKNIPYVNASRQVQYGTLVSTLDLAGDETTQPSTHVVHFSGEQPCDKNGEVIRQIAHSSHTKLLAEGVEVNHMFSSKPKPPAVYRDFHEKMTTYVNIISGHAQAIDQEVSATPFPVIETSEDESVFHYMDTASSRAEIVAATNKLALSKIAIVGLGGTGSYILDLVSKTPVREIHIFDGDRFSSHNAFRSPGAASVEELRVRPLKVEYLEKVYSRMHRHIIVHDYYVDETNVAELVAMDFVFLCLDPGPGRKIIFEALEEAGSLFIDVGMGIDAEGGSLRGILRITTSTDKQRNGKKWVSFAEGGGGDDYNRSIQVADLNSLNAALAVIRWKKLFGFYHDLEEEHEATYTIDGNQLSNDLRP